MKFIIAAIFILTSLFCLSQDKVMVRHGDTLYIVSHTYTTVPDSIKDCDTCSYRYFNRIVSTTKDSVQINKLTTANIPNTAGFITPAALTPYVPKSDTSATISTKYRLQIKTDSVANTLAASTASTYATISTVNGKQNTITAGSITNAQLVNGAVANLSGTNTGDNSVNTTYANDYRAANFIAGTNYLAPSGNGSALTGLTKTQVGLSNADNTSDANKPVSTAEQTALNLKANLASPTFTGTVILPASTSLTTPVIGVATGTSLAVTGVITSSGGGIGYATGNGGAVTQITSKSTTVVLNKLAGDITLINSALAAAAIVSFTLTNSTIAATDIIHVQHQATGTFGAYTITGRCAAGSAVISVRNNTAGSLSEAIVIRFIIVKSATN